MQRKSDYIRKAELVLAVLAAVFFFIPIFKLDLSADQLQSLKDQAQIYEVMGQDSSTSNYISFFGWISDFDSMNQTVSWLLLFGLPLLTAAMCLNRITGYLAFISNAVFGIFDAVVLFDIVVDSGGYTFTIFGHIYAVLLLLLVLVHIAYLAVSLVEKIYGKFHPASREAREKEISEYLDRLGVSKEEIK